MGNVLLVAEHNEGKLRPATANGVTFAAALKEHAGGELLALVIGQNVGDIATQMAGFSIDGVLKADNEALGTYMAETYATAVAKIAKDANASHVVCTATTFGKDLMPRVAALLEAGMASEVAEVTSAKGFNRPMVAGNAIGVIEVTTDVVVATCRQTEWDAAQPGGSASIKDVDVGELSTFGSVVEGLEIVKSDRPELTEAKTVVAGGRGLKTAENFKFVEELADTLTGAMGATRAACDAGMVPNDLQVGQTGKVVAPDLYFAIGLSGAIQHLAGMKSSKVIVAINKDEEAPIFEVADYGLVAKWEDTLGDLTAKIKAVQASKG